MSTATVDVGQFLESKPGVQGGRPVLRGTRITMQSVVAAHVFNKVPLEEIAEDNPHVPIAALYAVVAYYYAHQAEMDAEEEAEEREAIAMAHRLGAEII